ncbi:MAG: class I SAM-dependent methyltransferase [Janthinobacterium lividum]
MSGLAPYVTDIHYTARFYPETAPAHIAFAMAAAGQDPGRSRLPERVFELGCGRGFGLALLAAANPDVVFEGCDFNPRHVAEAQRFGLDAGLENLSVQVASFADLAGRDGARDVDLAIVHGVMAWVDAPTRHAVLAVLDARIAEGGVAFVSYNCEPGWATLDPLRQIARAVARMEPEATRRVPLLLDWLDRLQRSGAAYLAANPVVARHIRGMVEADPAYLSHEYLGAAARALAVDEVHRPLAALGLRYAASSTIAENIDALAVPPGVAELLAATEDPTLRETLRDLGTNRSFRRDLFRRGTGSPAAAAEALQAATFALAVPASEVGFSFDGPLGPLTGHPHLYAPLVDRLAAGPAAFAELLGLPVFAASGRAALVEALALLVHGGRVFPLMRPMADPDAAHRFNRTIVEHADRAAFYGHLASPVSRSGVAVEDLELLLLAARSRSGERLDARAATRLVDRLRQSRLDPHPYGAMSAEDVAKASSSFTAGLWPVLSALNVTAAD